ncbi:MAG: hypothetical protein EBZ74_02840 [Planctomycetia bacterium]|nr:hypothetical protein [Planctomycetia bacterium]
MRDTPLRRATIWLALAGYTVVVSGLPLPLGIGHGPQSAAAAKRTAGKDRSRPFPCMDKPCGCTTAEQCFANCCCNTPAELLAWARARKVEPGVITALSRRIAAEPTKTESCCAAASAACCAALVEDAEPACCAAEAAPPAAADEPAVESVRCVSLRALRACQGIAAEWFLVGVSLPPAATCISMRAAECTGRVAAFDVSTEGSRAAPDGPPPRRA